MKVGNTGFSHLVLLSLELKFLGNHKCSVVRLQEPLFVKPRVQTTDTTCHLVQTSLY